MSLSCGELVKGLPSSHLILPKRHGIQPLMCHLLPLTSHQRAWWKTYIYIFSHIILFCTLKKNFQYSCFTILFYSIKQSDSVTGIHFSFPSWFSLPPLIPSHPSRSPREHWVEQFCYTVGSYQLTVLHMPVHIHQFQLPSSSHQPTPCPHVCSLHPHLLLPCKEVYLYYFSRFSI